MFTVFSEYGDTEVLFKVQGLRFKVQGLKFKVQGLKEGVSKY